MHSSPHPNQVRSACERCRRQKLRCSRPVGASASCARCTRLGLACQPGLQRRVGRPPRKDLVLRKSPEAAMGTNGPCRSPEDTLFLQGLLDDPIPGVDWDLGAFCFDAPQTLPFPMDAWPAVRELDPSDVEQQIVRPGNVHFQTLSRLNVETHKSLEYLSRMETKMRWKSFICNENNMINGYKNLQMVMRSTQEFLAVVKALHRQLGTRVVCRKEHHSPLDSMTLVLDPSLSGIESSSSTGSPSSRTTSPSPPPVFDSPTIFLVISCYTQIVKHLELAIKLIYDSATDATQDVLSPGPIELAGVALIEASTQFILFCEVVYHVLGQINLVLGLPSSWSGRSAWTGLLACQRYRDMVNVELGSVQGLWTVRPSRLLDMTRATKEVFVELSMTGFDA
ncbi:hypothetical protein FZEAL_5917 [Fusarium zealandicum]|uniref:Zn(2)-C6 fungal-type domain-containing protein n=1 Tax=Fusarium zealandicum TaxID=1053134 RepID=A0A8H4UIV5_9HYPO|nr:hypothetical protein FZEAL_5917 [Fusarium zealandicum]